VGRASRGIRFRAFSRLGGIERELPAPAYEIPASNFWKALRMFHFDDGGIWVHSVPHRPALGVVSGALLAIGVVLVLARYVRNRHWLDSFLLASLPLLQLPSTLSLAFPEENPALSRAGAASIPAFVVAAMALDGLLSGLGGGRRQRALAWVVTGALLFGAAFQNHGLVFDQYESSFRQRSWNTSDTGAVIGEFAQVHGRMDTAWIVPHPHWMDTRLPAVWACIPNRDMALWREDLPTTLELPGPKLFLVRANLEDPTGNDRETLHALRSLYPDGRQRLFDSGLPGHDFWRFFVPDRSAARTL
jgi:hypothetical protein